MQDPASQQPSQAGDSHLQAPQGGAFPRLSFPAYVFLVFLCSFGFIRIVAGGAYPRLLFPAYLFRVLLWLHSYSLQAVRT